MKDTDPKFRPKPDELPRSERLREFYADNPSFDIKKSLNFLISEYPDTDSWVVHSGLAVLLLAGQRDVDPSDLDILCRDEEMAEDFGRWNGTDDRWERYLDAKSVDKWLTGRSQVLDGDQAWQYILASSVLMDIGEGQFRVMHPALVAAEKSTLTRMVPRPKDYADVATLGIGNAQLDAATDLIRGVEPDRNLSVLLDSYS